MKTLDDVKKALEGLENDGTELYKVVVDAIGQERSHGKNRVESAEAAANAANEALKAIGFDSKTMKIEEFSTDLKAKLSKVEESTAKMSDSEKVIAELQASVKKLEDAGKSAAEENQAYKRTIQNNTLRDAILPVLSKKLYGSTAHTDLLISKGLAVLGTDNKTVHFKDENGDLIDFDKGITDFVSKHEKDIINTQKPGPGNGPSNQNASGKSMSRAEFRALPPAERIELSKERIEITD